MLALSWAIAALWAAFASSSARSFLPADQILWHHPEHCQQTCVARATRAHRHPG